MFAINIRKNLKRISILLLALVSSGTSLYAQFEDTGAGARPSGMGNAFTALANDVHGIYYNPAGLGALTRAEFTSEYARLYWKLDDGSNLGDSLIAYVHPLGKWGTAGVGYSGLALSGDYNENTFILSYGRRFGIQALGGLNIKLLHQNFSLDEYTQDDPVFSSRTSMTKLSFDMGTLFDINHALCFGLVLTDINQPDFLFYETDSSETGRVSRGLKAGIAYREESVNIAVDAGLKGNNLKFYTGMEKWFYEYNFALRSGLGLGTNGFRNLSMGASYKFKSSQVDYTFIAPLSIGGTAGTHRFSLTLNFGISPEDVRMEMRKRTLIENLEERIRNAELKANKAEETAEQALREIRERPYGKEYEKIIIREKAEIPRKEEKLSGEDRMYLYTVQPSETLQSIAIKIYGDANRWIDIYNANKYQIKKGSLAPGQNLVLPRR